jgi:DNA processing protein
LIAESPIGAKPTERHFPRRNRIVAGLAIAVVVIEAAERSGSLITARFAMEENREVMAAPGFPTDPRSAGANRLIRDGALLVRSADDILAGLPTGLIQPAPSRPKEEAPAFRKQDEILVSSTSFSADDPHQLVKNALAAAPVTVDELTRECQLSPSTVAAILQELELGGELERLPGQRVALR